MFVSLNFRMMYSFRNSGAWQASQRRSDDEQSWRSVALFRVIAENPGLEK